MVLGFQEGFMRTVVPPSSVVLDVEVEALIAIATGEPRTVRADELAPPEALAGEAGCEHQDPLQKWDSVGVWESSVGDRHRHTDRCR